MPAGIRLLCVQQRWSCRLFRKLHESLANRCARGAGEFAFIPLDNERLAAFIADQCCPRAPQRHSILNDLLHTGNGFRFVASKLATFPPKTGQRWSDAYAFPALHIDAEHGLPADLRGVSMRFCGFPISLNCVGSFNEAVWALEVRAASAREQSSDFLCREIHDRVVLGAALRFGTFISERRLEQASSHAVAPLSRKDSHDVRMLWLPKTP